MWKWTFPLLTNEMIMMPHMVWQMWVACYWVHWLLHILEQYSSQWYHLAWDDERQDLTVNNTCPPYWRLLLNVPIHIGAKLTESAKSPLDCTGGVIMCGCVLRYKGTFPVYAFFFFYFHLFVIQFKLWKASMSLCTETSKPSCLVTFNQMVHRAFCLPVTWE